MAPDTLAVSALLHFVMGGAFAYVGLGLARRRVDPLARAPVLAFAAWWLALGASTLVSGTTELLGWMGFTHLGVFGTFSDLNALLVIGGLAALLYYLIYLFTGRHAIVVVAIFFAVVYGLALFNMNARVPIGVEVRTWDTDLVFANPDAGVPRWLLFLALLVPPVAGAAGMLALVPRAPGATQRFRLVLVAGSVLVWLGGVLFAGIFAGLDDHPAFGLVARLLGLAAAGAAYLAYYPPAWARRRWGVEGILEEPRPRAG